MVGRETEHSLCPSVADIMKISFARKQVEDRATQAKQLPLHPSVAKKMKMVFALASVRRQDHGQFDFTKGTTRDPE
jgi:hypothetical protein